VNESLFVMGKNTVEEQNLPVSDGAASARNNGGGGISTCCCCDWISSYFSLRCVLILAFSAAVFLSALFWLPPFLGFADPGDLDLDPRFKGIYRVFSLICEFLHTLYDSVEAHANLASCDS